MTDLAVRVRQLGKRYEVGEQVGYRAFRDVLAKTFDPRRLFGKMPAEPDAREFWALEDVTFDLHHGEVAGIIGKNGAGKSTLLKLLSRITKPTVGTAELHGRVGSLLEVGTGFHPELTGKENIFVSGAILGMSHREIAARMDEIIAFAEVERFIDTPVKRYSSGMYVRLAFAVAAHLETEILLVDEVLAVGDIAFQERCLGKIHSVARGGRTVMLVSHNMGAIRRLCQRALCFDAGRLVFDGPVEDAVSNYMGIGAGECRSVMDLRGDPHAVGEDIRLLEVRVLDEHGKLAGTIVSDQGLMIEVDHEWLRPVPNGRISIEIRNSEHEKIFVSRDDDDPAVRSMSRRVGRCTARCHVPAYLLNHGSYSVCVYSSIPGVKWCVMMDHVASFNVDALAGLAAEDGGKRPGAVLPLLRWDLEPMKYVVS